MTTTDNLSQALELATNDPAERTNFYNTLINSQVFIILAEDSDETQAADKNSLAIIQLMNQENQLLFPFFSSLERFSEFVGTEARYAQIDFLNFLQAIQCGPAVLNPGSEYCKEFTKPELEALLDGRLLQHANEHTIHAGDSVYIGQPEQQPLELISLLTDCFSKYHHISEAYLAQIAYENDSVGPHPLVALRANAAIAEALAEAEHSIKSNLGQDVVVDFIELSASDELSAYFQDIQPFYKR